MKVKVGTAPDNWGVWFPADEKQTPWDRYLDEVAQAGYDLTELGPYGYLPTDPKALRQELDKRGLSLGGGYTFAKFADKDKWPELEMATRESCALTSQFGAQFHLLIDFPYTNLFTGEPIDEAEAQGDRWKVFVDHCQRLGEITRSYGQTAVFHPHTDTHVQYEHQIEKLMEDTEPGLVDVCLDTGHHAYRGGDPVSFMRKHHKRIPYLHIKSVDGEFRDKVLRENIPFAIAVGQDMFCPPSRGVVNFKEFKKVLEDVNYEGPAIVEQDMYPVMDYAKPLPIARETRKYLREIGLG